MSMKNSNDTIGNEPAVPQPTPLPRAATFIRGLLNCQTASLNSLAPTVHSKYKPQGYTSLLRVKNKGLHMFKKICLHAGNTIIRNSG
jgi:hypothetical protein